MLTITRLPQGGPELSLAPSIPPPSAAGVDPEASVCSVGMLSLGPAQLTAHAHIALPELLLKDVDPLESLKSFGKKFKKSCFLFRAMADVCLFVCLFVFLTVSRQSVASMPEPPEYDTVYRMLQEVCLFWGGFLCPRSHFVSLPFQHHFLSPTFSNL